MKILSGVFVDERTGRQVTTGTPIALMIENVDQRSKDYSDITECYRPGHADYTYDVKYGVRDYRGGGRSSARETAARVAAGAVARKIIPGIMIRARSCRWAPTRQSRPAGIGTRFCQSVLLPGLGGGGVLCRLSRRFAQGRLLHRRGARDRRRGRAAGLGAPSMASSTRSGRGFDVDQRGQGRRDR